MIDLKVADTTRFAARALAVPLRSVARMAGLFEPWLLLLTRVWLAQAFLTLQIVAMVGSSQGPSAALAGAWWRDTFQQIAASGWGSAIEALCPLLLILGLAVRPASLLLLIQVAILQQGRTTLHVFWVLLLACLIVRGAGRISLEALFARGVSRSAIPGVRLVTSLRHWCDRRGTPIMLVTLRLVIAGVLLFRFGDAGKQVYVRTGK